MDVGNEGYVLTPDFNTFSIGPKIPSQRVRQKTARVPMWAYKPAAW